MMKKFALILAAVALAAMTAAPMALAEGQSVKKPCPWKITKVAAGKWGNGNKKAGLWLKGSFPLNIPGVTERPDWYVNGSKAGKSQLAIGGGRFLPNSSSKLIDKQQNTIKVQFNKEPYNGASHSLTFYMDWSKVPNGGYYTFK